MAWVRVENVSIKNPNPCGVGDDFSLEVSFTCLRDLECPLFWRLIYVGSPHDKSRDQELDVVELEHLRKGVMKFTFEADAPDLKQVDPDDVWGTTVLLLEASYRGQDFIRVGWYLHNYYEDPVLQDDPPDIPLYEQLKRYIVHTDPRITRFNINWSGTEEEALQLYNFPQPPPQVRSPFQTQTDPQEQPSYPQLSQPQEQPPPSRLQQPQEPELPPSQGGGIIGNGIDTNDSGHNRLSATNSKGQAPIGFDCQAPFVDQNQSEMVPGPTPQLELTESMGEPDPQPQPQPQLQLQPQPHPMHMQMQMQMKMQNGAEDERRSSLTTCLTSPFSAPGPIFTACAPSLPAANGFSVSLSPGDVEMA